MNFPPKLLMQLPAIHFQMIKIKNKSKSNPIVRSNNIQNKSFFTVTWNIGFPNGPVFRYGNFFFPRVEKSSKISPRAKNLVLPRAVGPWEARFFSHGLIFEDFSTRGMKKFSYLKTTAHSEIRFPHGPCGNLISFH